MSRLATEILRSMAVVSRGLTCTQIKTAAGMQLSVEAAVASVAHIQMAAVQSLFLMG